MKNKKSILKKMVALGIAFTMMFSVIACGSKEDTPQAESGAAATVTEGADPSSLESYEITMAYIGDSYPDMEKVQGEMNKILQPKFNCTIKLLTLSWGDFAQKLTLMLSGDENLDILPVITGSGATYLNNGYVMEIQDLVAKYGSEIAAAVGEENVYVCSVNGKTYGVPTSKEYVRNVGVMMRKDLLDASGYTVEDIKSMADLDTIYAAVKEQNPDMTMLAGRKAGTPGFDSLYCDNLSDMFGVIMPDDKKGTVVNYFETDQFKENAQLLYEFAQKGYISKDCATMNETRQSQVKAGTAFSYFTPIKPGVDLQDSLDTGYEMVHAMISDGFRSTDQMSFIGWGLGRNCKYPERAMEVLNFMYGSAELNNLLNWGIEGEHYVFEDKEKGIINYPEGVTAETKTYGLNMGYQIPNQFIANIWSGNDPSIWDEYREFNTCEPLVSTGFIYNDANVLTEKSALSNVYNEYFDAIGSGAVDPAIAIPQMNEALKAAGLDTVIQEKQSQLDAFLASKK